MCRALCHHELDDEPEADEVHRVVRHGIHDAGEGDVELAVLVLGVECRLEGAPADQLEPRSRERPAVDDPVRHEDERDNHRIDRPPECAHGGGVDRDVERAGQNAGEAGSGLVQSHVFGLQKIIAHEMPQQSKYEQVCHGSLHIIVKNFLLDETATEVVISIEGRM